MHIRAGTSCDIYGLYDIRHSINGIHRNPAYIQFMEIPCTVLANPNHVLSLILVDVVGWALACSLPWDAG